MTKYIVTAWMLVVLGIGGAGLGFSGAWYIQGLRLDAAKHELTAVKNSFNEFKDKVKETGDAAQKAADKRAADEKLKKEKSDHEYETRITNLNADVKRMRNARSGGNFVPSAASTAQSPDRACFSKAELEQSIRNFDQGIQRLVDQGSADGIALDVAKHWAQSLNPEAKK